MAASPLARFDEGVPAACPFASRARARTHETLTALSHPPGVRWRWGLTGPPPPPESSLSRARMYARPGIPHPQGR